MSAKAIDRVSNQLAAQNIGDEARAVSSMMAMPIDYPPVRVADTYSADETGLAQAITKLKVNWDAGATTLSTNGRQLPVNDWGAFIFPSLLRHSVVYTTVSPQAVIPSGWTYQACTNVFGTGVNLNVQNDQGTFNIEPASWVSTGATAPHGPILFAGQAEGRVGVWIDASTDVGTNASLVVTLNAVLPVDAAACLTTYQWNGGRWKFFGTTKIGAGNAILTQSTITISGYYAFTLGITNWNTDAGIPVTFTMVLTCRTTSCWAHHYVNHALLNLQNIGRNRILGLAFLLQNEASVMNKQGNVVAKQIPAGYDWFSALAGNGAGFYNTMFDDDNSRTFLLETGIYGFKRPKGSQDFDWENEVDQISVPNGATANLVQSTAKAYFQIACPCDYLALAAEATAVGAGDCLLTTAVGIEYTTQNSWIDTSTPAISEGAFKLGIATLREVDQFYENPIHLPSIMDAISSGMRTMAPIVGLFPGMGPALAGGLMTGGQIVGQVRNAIYGNQPSEQGENMQLKDAQKARKRMANLEQTVANGRTTRRRR